MEIKIGKSARCCTQCERVFIHEEEVTSLVRIVEGKLEREDFCAACWTPDRAQNAYSVWTPRYYDPQVAEQEPPEVFSPLRQLFYEAVDSTSRVDLAMAFLAAQLLRRQKVFRRIKESDEADGETHILLYADRIGNRLIEVRDPNFSYAEMETGRAALIKRLQELETPEGISEPGEDADLRENEIASECG